MQVRLHLVNNPKPIRRDKKGRFAKRVSKQKSLGVIEQLLLASTLVVFASVVAHDYYDSATQPIIYVAEAREVEVQDDVQDDVQVDVQLEVEWTPERIAEEIDRVFPDAPIMHKVMWCESRGDIDAYNPTNNSHDNGLFQISDLYHGERVRALGLDVGDPADNIAFARILYDESGLQPWSASKPCWST